MGEMVAEISHAVPAMCKKATATNALNEKRFIGLTRKDERPRARPRVARGDSVEGISKVECTPVRRSRHRMVRSVRRRSEKEYRIRAAFLLVARRARSRKFGCGS